MDRKILSQNLESLGRKYESEYLSIWKNTNLDSDSWEALKFFFSHSFMRGRRDELSVEYYEFTVKVLAQFFEINCNDNSDKLFKKLKIAKNQGLFATENIRELKKDKRNSIKHKNFENKIRRKNPLIESLTTNINVEIEFPQGNNYEKKIHLQNDADLLMVLDTLNFMSMSVDSVNLYKHFKELFESNKIKDAYLELNKLSGVGDKISTFYLRDIAIMNNYNLVGGQTKYVFPVDTWVAQITSLLANKQFSAGKPDEIKDYFIENFPETNLPIIAAGIWYLGFNSLNISIEYVKINLLHN